MPDIVNRYSIKNQQSLNESATELNGKNLKLEPSQDVKQKYSTWKESNKSDNYCMELIFEEKQSIIVTVDGNTKVIEFYGLIMVLNKTSNGAEVAMYFSTSEGTSKNYTTSPILVNAKQNGLYKLAASLASK